MTFKQLISNVDVRLISLPRYSCFTSEKLSALAIEDDDLKLYFHPDCVPDNHFITAVLNQF